MWATTEASDVLVGWPEEPAAIVGRNRPPSVAEQQRLSGVDGRARAYNGMGGFSGYRRRGRFPPGGIAHGAPTGARRLRWCQ